MLGLCLFYFVNFYRLLKFSYSSRLSSMPLSILSLYSIMITAHLFRAHWLLKVKDHSLFPTSQITATIKSPLKIPCILLFYRMSNPEREESFSWSNSQHLRSATGDSTQWYGHVMLWLRILGSCLCCGQYSFWKPDLLLRGSQLRSWNCWIWVVQSQGRQDYTSADLPSPNYGSFPVSCSLGHCNYSLCSSQCHQLHCILCELLTIRSEVISDWHPFSSVDTMHFPLIF